MALTIYTFWADRIIAGTHTIKQVPPSFRDQVQKILVDRKYVIRKDGTAIKKIQNGNKS